MKTIITQIVVSFNQNDIEITFDELFACCKASHTSSNHNNMNTFINWKIIAVIKE
jgi:hypothetical protein